jgi:hypothetical protein
MVISSSRNLAASHEKEHDLYTFRTCSCCHKLVTKKDIRLPLTENLLQTGHGVSSSVHRPDGHTTPIKKNTAFLFYPISEGLSRDFPNIYDVF